MTARIDLTTLGRVLSATAVFATAGLLLNPGRADAQTNATTYFACYVPGSGTVYRIKAPNTPSQCKKSNHVEFQWTDFVRAIEPFITQSTFYSVPGELVLASASCPPGSIMYTGGYDVHNEGMRILASFPHGGTVDPDLALRTWVVHARNESAVEIAFTVFARCARL